MPKVAEDVLRGVPMIKCTVEGCMCPAVQMFRVTDGYHHAFCAVHTDEWQEAVELAHKVGLHPYATESHYTEALQKWWRSAKPAEAVETH